MLFLTTAWEPMVISGKKIQLKQVIEIEMNMGN